MADERTRERDSSSLAHAEMRGFDSVCALTLGALLLLTERDVVLPPEAVAAHVKTGGGGANRSGEIGHAFKDAGAREDGGCQATCLQRAQDPPCPATRAVLEHGLRSQVPHPGRCVASALAERSARVWVTVGHGRLRALFHVQHDVHRQHRTSGPACLWRLCTVTNEVTLRFERHRGCIVAAPLPAVATERHRENESSDRYTGGDVEETRARRPGRHRSVQLVP